MAAAEPGTGGRNRSTLPILFSVIIIDLIAFGIIIPVLPAYAKDLGESALMLGVLLATHAALQFVFAPIWGRLSDRIGRRPIMLFSMFGTSVSMVILGVADSFEGLLLARVLSGTFSANISVATAYVADVTQESERTRFMGMIGASFGVGFILGPALGGGLAWLGHGAPMFFAAGLAFINCIWAAFALVEPQKSEGAKQPRSGFIGALRDAMSDSVAARLCTTNFFFTLGVTQLESTFFYFMNDRFGYSLSQVAFILVAMAVLMAGIQGGGIRSLAARFGERSLLITGLAMLALSFPLVPAAGGLIFLMLALSLSAIGRAISQPPMTSIISMRTAQDNRGTLMGAFQSSAALARILGPVAAGLLYVYSLSAPFILGGLLFLLAAMITLGLRNVDAPQEPQTA